MMRIGKLRRRKRQQTRRMGRRKGEEFKFPQSGHGKRQKMFLRSQT
jgi:hypothetical protein